MTPTIEETKEDERFKAILEIIHNTAEYTVATQAPLYLRKQAIDLCLAYAYRSGLEAALNTLETPGVSRLPFGQKIPALRQVHSRSDTE